MQWTVAGHIQQKEYFGRMMDAGTLAHAYLFHGPQGVGKRMMAGELAAVLMSDSGLTLENNPDFILLQPGMNKETGKTTEIPVESVRAMKAWAYQRPLYGSRKVVLIDDADQMSDAASNTVLKVLEEPPSYLTFLLVSSREGQVLETIISRCQNISFRPLSDEEMQRVLDTLKIPADDRKLTSAIAAGRPGMALELLQEKKMTDVTSAIAGLEKIRTAGLTERIVYAKKIADDDDAAEIVYWWLAWTHAHLDSSATGLLELYDAMHETKFNRRLALEKFLLELPTSG